MIIDWKRTPIIGIGFTKHKGRFFGEKPKPILGLDKPKTVVQHSRSARIGGSAV
jgi:hypothetical protein